MRARTKFWSANPAVVPETSAQVPAGARLLEPRASDNVVGNQVGELQTKKQLCDGDVGYTREAKFWDSGISSFQAESANSRCKVGDPHRRSCHGGNGGRRERHGVPQSRQRVAQQQQRQPVLVVRSDHQRARALLTELTQTELHTYNIPRKALFLTHVQKVSPQNNHRQFKGTDTCEYCEKSKRYTDLKKKNSHRASP